MPLTQHSLRLYDNNMEHKHIITVGDDTYIVHMELHDGFLGGSPNRAQADVYDSIPWEKSDGTKGVGYSSGTEGCLAHDELNDDCRKPFTMTVCWRGCWDERCYPGDDEYWDGEFAKMAAVEEVIKPMLRKMVCDANDHAEMKD